MMGVTYMYLVLGAMTIYSGWQVQGRVVKAIEESYVEVSDNNVVSSRLTVVERLLSNRKSESTSTDNQMVSQTMPGSGSCVSGKCTVCNTVQGYNICAVATTISGGYSVTMDAMGYIKLHVDVTASGDAHDCTNNVPAPLTTACLNVTSVSLTNKHGCVSVSFVTSGQQFNVSIDCFTIPNARQSKKQLPDNNVISPMRAVVERLLSNRNRKPESAPTDNQISQTLPGSVSCVSGKCTVCNTMQGYNVCAVATTISGGYSVTMDVMGYIKLHVDVTASGDAHDCTNNVPAPLTTACLNVTSVSLTNKHGCVSVFVVTSGQQFNFPIDCFTIPNALPSKKQLPDNKVISPRRAVVERLLSNRNRKPENAPTDNQISQTLPGSGSCVSGKCTVCNTVQGYNICAVATTISGGYRVTMDAMGYIKLQVDVTASGDAHDCTNNVPAPLTTACLNVTSVSLTNKHGCVSVFVVTSGQHFNFPIDCFTIPNALPSKKQLSDNNVVSSRLTVVERLLSNRKSESASTDNQMVSQTMPGSGSCVSGKCTVCNTVQGYNICAVATTISGGYSVTMDAMGYIKLHVDVTASGDAHDCTNNVPAPLTTACLNVTDVSLANKHGCVSVFVVTSGQQFNFAIDCFTIPNARQSKKQLPDNNVISPMRAVVERLLSNRNRKPESAPTDNQISQTLPRSVSCLSGKCTVCNTVQGYNICAVATTISGGYRVTMDAMGYIKLQVDVTASGDAHDCTNNVPAPLTTACLNVTSVSLTNKHGCVSVFVVTSGQHFNFPIDCFTIPNALPSKKQPSDEIGKLLGDTVKNIVKDIVSDSDQATKKMGGLFMDHMKPRDPVLRHEAQHVMEMSQPGDDGINTP